MALSPMMKFYLTMKESYKDCILFFRLGDFYEMFFDDAKLASNILDLTLTGRDCGLEERAPMCGIPYHAADSYIQKLVSSGRKVAICEQLSDPSESKGLVERDVVRVITPGTVIEDFILDDKKNNYLATLAVDAKSYSIAWVDISTGEFNVAFNQLKSFNDVEDMLVSIAPSEIICNEKAFEMSKDLPKIRLDRFPKFQHSYEWSFGLDAARLLIQKQFDIASIAKFEIDDKPLAISACGALINYLNETQKRALAHINSIKFVQNNRFMIVDSVSRRNLEITESARDGSKKATLLWVLDKTRTAMGARNLRRWLEQPIRDEKLLNSRLTSVQEFVENTKIRTNLYEKLSGIKDIERLTSKIAFGNPSPRDLVALKYSLQSLPEVKNIISECTTSGLVSVNKNILLLENICELLENSIDDNCPQLIKDGGYIKSGYNQLLDDYRGAKTEASKWLAELEVRERETTGIKTLKVGYNRVFGYYIEVSKMNVDKVPFYYARKQTLSTGERYITEELKNIEDKILGAAEKSIAIENKIFEEIKLALMKEIVSLQGIARAIAMIDTLLSFAIVAVANNYCKPTINEKIDNIAIVEGRHPVVEQLVPTNQFVPNDTILDCTQNRTMIITGPNMAGKSTYMRQVALITYMAHLGSYVPAKSAQISVTDRIFTRIGASDDLAYGQSTFMVEMVEVATILQNATLNSLLILDEIGRGTSTFDGLSIARAVMEEVTQNIRCKTLFSTHYHELTDLEGMLEGVKNYKIIATERDKGIIFLHKIMRGGTNKSFGIEVAKLAGLPSKVIARAKEISKTLELNPINTNKKEEDYLPLLACDSEEQLTKTNLINEKIAEEIKHIDIDNITPMQAFVTLSELLKIFKSEQ